MVWPVLLALGGGAVADGALNDGRITRSAGGVISDAFGNIISGGNNDGPRGANNLGEGDRHNAGGRNLMDLLGNSQALLGGGGIAGAMALQFTSAPDFIKKIAWGAAILNLAFQAYRMFTSNNFDEARDPDNEWANRRVVTRDGIDLDDPNMVSGRDRDNDRRGPDPEFTAEAE